MECPTSVRLTLRRWHDERRVARLRTRVPGCPPWRDCRSARPSTCVAVPAAAVFRDGDGDAVWVVDGGVVERRAVTLGAQGVDTIEIDGGPGEGEIVVVRGADQVRDGQSLP